MKFSLLIMSLFLLPNVLALTAVAEVPCCEVFLNSGEMISSCEGFDLSVEMCENILEDWRKMKEGYEEDHYYGEAKDYPDYPDEPRDYYGEAKDYPDDDYYDKDPAGRDYIEEYDYRDDNYREEYKREYKDGEYREEYKYRDGDYREEYDGRPDRDRYEYRDENKRFEYDGRVPEHFEEYDDEFSSGIIVEEWIDPVEDSFCTDTAALTTRIITKMKNRFGDDFTNECRDMERRAKQCFAEAQSHCDWFEKDYKRECEMDYEDHFEHCMEETKRSWHTNDYDCEDEYERASQNCEEYNRKCHDRDGWIDNCHEDMKQEYETIGGEDHDIPDPAYETFENECIHAWEEEIREVNCEEEPDLCEGKEGFFEECIQNYEDEYRPEYEAVMPPMPDIEEECERRWEAEHDWFCEDMKQHCEKDEIYDRCMEDQERMEEQQEEEMKRHCEDQAHRMKEHSEENCERLIREKERCYEDSDRHCEYMVKKAEQCFEMDWTKIEEKVQHKVKRHCGLVSKAKDHEVIDKLLQVDEEEIEGLDVVIEDNAETVVEVKEEVDKIKEAEAEKNAVYKVMRFFGLKREAEQREIEQLNDAKERMDQAIERLEKVQELIESEEAKLALGQAMDILEMQREGIDEFINQRTEAASGILGRVTG